MQTSHQKTLTQPLYGPLVLDLVGTGISSIERSQLLDPRVGGVILFARNFTSRKQLCKLTDAIHTVREGTNLPKLLIAVDHEGGRVQRFKTDGFTHLPPMAKLGQLWLSDPLTALRVASHVGYVLAAELLACGVDFSFTPVLDLDYGASGVIGDRAFAPDERAVAVLSRAFMGGLNRAGMRTCGKHFPGHGFVAADSHHEIPVDDRSLEQILSRDAAPYGWLHDVLDAVMPAHVIYPQVDTAPAGFSKRWLTILRQDMHFTGVIFSDDLSMAGATVAGDVHARAKAALSAGCDMVLVCNAPEMVQDLLQGNALKQTAKSAQLSHQRIARLLPSGQATGLNWAMLQKQSVYINALLDVESLK